MAMATELILTVIFSAFLGRHMVISQSILHFQEEPLSTNVYDGQTLTLRCVLQSSWATGVVHWVKDERIEISRGTAIQTRLLADATRFSIVGDRSQGNSNLQVTNVRPSDAGSYVCHLYDSYGSHQAETVAATITVLPVQPPLIGYPRCPLSIPNPQPGDTIIFRCYSIGEQPPATLSFWRGPHEELQVERHIGTHGGVFFERQLNEDDNNVTFTCMARGPAFKAEKHRNCTVVPFVVPTIVNIVPPIAEVPAGMTATFRCNTVAVPQVSKYRWWIWNNGWDRILRTGGRYAIDGDGESMRILDINKYDDGRKVRCIARNPLGLKGEAEGRLRVYAAPVVKPTARVPNWSGVRPGTNNRFYNSTNPKEDFENDGGFKIRTGPNVFLIVGCVVAGFFGIIFISCLVLILVRRNSRDNKHGLKQLHNSKVLHTEHLINRESMFKSDVVDKGIAKLAGYATIDAVSNSNTHIMPTNQFRSATMDPKPLYAQPVVRSESKQNTILETSRNATRQTKKNNLTEKNMLNPEVVLAMYAKPMKSKGDKKNTLDDRPTPSPRRNSGNKSGTYPSKQKVATRPKSDILYSKPNKPNNKQKIYENSSLGLDRDELSNTEESNIGQNRFNTKNNVEGLVYAELNLREPQPVHFVRSTEVNATEYAQLKK